MNENELTNIARWGLTGEYEHSGCWDESDNIDDAIMCAVDDFKEFLSKPYPQELGDIPDNPIIYRLVKVDDITNVRRENMGKSWFSNPQQVKNPEFFDMLPYIKPGRDNKVFIIKGKTSKDNIDLPRTLWERSTQWWENEIVLLDDNDIEILDIRELSQNDILRESIRNILKEETRFSK
jgi:hypothetical protein